MQNGSHSTYHFTKWFFLNIMLLRFIHIYICTFSLLCSILFIYSFSCWWICRWFPVFPYYKQCYIGLFFYARHRTLLMFNLLVAGWLSSGIWWRVQSPTARVRISPEVNCRVEGHAHLRFSRPCQVALQWLYQFISPPAAYESFCLSTLHPYKYLVVALFNYFTNTDMKWYLHTV